MARARLLGGNSADSRIAPLEPRCTSETKSRDGHLCELIVANTRTRDHREAESAHPSQQRLAERIAGRAERHTDQNPAYFFRRRSDNSARTDAAPANSAIAARVREVHDIPPNFFCIALRARQVENVVGIDVLLVETVVGNGTVDARVTEDPYQRIAPLTCREVAECLDYRGRPGERVVDDSDRTHDITREAIVVDSHVERAGEGITLTVEPVEPLQLPPKVARVARRRRTRSSANGQRVGPEVHRVLGDL